MDLTYLRPLGSSGLLVSPLALGTMTFGTPRWGMDEATSRSVFDRYVGLGGNFIDTADVYSGGASEEMVGKFVGESALRERMVLATKSGFNTGNGPHEGGHGRSHIEASVDRSLKRMKIDFIDLYWIHIWDGITPAIELLQTMSGLVATGKIRYWGLSNSPAWFVAQLATLARVHGLPGPIGLQYFYSLVERGVEDEHVPLAREFGMGLVPWSPLAYGLLTGKYDRATVEAGPSRSGGVPNSGGEAGGRPDDDKRLDGDNPFGDALFTDRNWRIADALTQVAADMSETPARVALAWVAGRPGVASTLMGVTRVNSSRNDRNEEIASVRLDYTNNDTVQLFLKGYFHDWKTAYVRILNDLDGAGNLTGTTTTLYPAGTFWGYKDYGGSAVVKLHLHKGLEYLLGYDFQTFSGRDDVFLIGDLKEKVHAGIFQVRTTDELSSKGRLAAGARYNKTGGNKKTVWNVSGRYDFSPAFFAEANGGTSFVLPSAEQLYLIDPCCEVGNPNLKPEQSLNLNASVGGRIGAEGSAINWQATYFYRRITDLIDYAYPDNPAFPNGTFENVNGKVFVHGFEILADARVGNGLNLSASYTRNSSRTEGSDRQRDRTPRDLFKGSIFYRPEDKPFGGNLTVNWTGDAYAKPSGFVRQNYGNYAVVNAGLFVHPDGQARRHRLSVNLENIFNNEYASRGYGSAPIDGSTDRFLYFSRGTPRTLRVGYGVAF